MKPIEFEGQTVIFAKDQPEYLPLPAKLHNDKEGTITTVWELSEEEKELIAKTGKLCIDILTFHNPLQPLRPYVANE